MNRLSLVGVVALATLMLPAISCESGSMDLLAQKLEDHFNGKDLKNAITFAECRAALDDFLSWDSATAHDKILKPGPLRHAISYLSDFLRNSLEFHPERTATTAAATTAFRSCIPKLGGCKKKNTEKEFVEKLESTYKKFRPIYGFQLPLKKSPIGQLTLALASSLSQEKGSEHRVDSRQIDRTWEELGKNFNEWKRFVHKEDLFEKSDEFAQLSGYVMAPETWAIIEAVLPLTDQNSMKLMYSEDQRLMLPVFRQWQHAYQARLAELKSMALP